MHVEMGFMRAPGTGYLQIVEGDGDRLRDKRLKTVNMSPFQYSQINLWVQCKHNALKV